MTHQENDEGQNNEREKEVKVEHDQPPVLDAVGHVASSDRGEYAVVEHGPEPRQGHRAAPCVPLARSHRILTADWAGNITSGLVDQAAVLVCRSFTESMVESRNSGSWVEKVGYRSLCCVTHRDRTHKIVCVSILLSDK